MGTLVRVVAEERKMGEPRHPEAKQEGHEPAVVGAFALVEPPQDDGKREAGQRNDDAQRLALDRESCVKHKGLQVVGP